ncbi:MAG: ABC transporter ATP-binding protein [Proteobacteria bacterium]|nr:ABC transporter ATP-binding protein [Burkholderiales bacterium]
MSAFLTVENLRKVFAAQRGAPPLTVFDQVNFTVGEGEFVCIIGHSGCGKSTILNVLAGLDHASSGYVFMDGREVRGPSLDRGVVFQGHALMPWLSAEKNVAFAVRSRWPGYDARRVKAVCDQYLSMVGLCGSEHKRPAELSGGMKQRVGIARAFAIEPKMLLLDEPFGALDALTRGVIQDELLKICAQTRQTVFMITHDVDEAILLADRILLMTNAPDARIAEVVVNTMPRTRSRPTLHKDPQFYRIRNHLVDFLVNRSKTFRDETLAGFDPASPPVLRPGLHDPAPAMPQGGPAGLDALSAHGPSHAPDNPALYAAK